MRFVFALQCVIFSLAVSFDASAKDKCPAVNCDCSALPSQTLKSRCEKEETFSKESCKKNKGVPDMFCGVHGPAATPLALQLKLEEIEPLENESVVKTLKRQMIILHWSIRDDFASVQKKVSKKDFTGASQVIKLLNTNVDRVFRYQRQIDDTLKKEDNNWASKSGWKDFTKQTSRTLKDFESYGEMLWENYTSAVKPKDKKSFKTLSLRILNTAGKLSEILAYSFGQAGAHSKAAEIWRDSARVSNSLAEKVGATSKNEEHKKYYLHQAAARWNRASYHWALEKNQKKMLSAHNSGREALGEEPIELEVQEVAPEPKPVPKDKPPAAKRKLKRAGKL